MPKRMFNKAPLIDDHSGLNISGTIVLLSNQTAGHKHIFTGKKLTNTDEIDIVEDPICIDEEPAVPASTPIRSLKSLGKTTLVPPQL